MDSDKEDKEVLTTLNQQEEPPSSSDTKLIDIEKVDGDDSDDK